MPDIFRIMATPNPSEVAIAVGVQATQLRPTNIPTPGTAYQDISYIRHIRPNEGWGTYQYSGMSNDTDTGLVMFYFAMAKTDTERNTPFRSRTYFDVHSWPPILHSLQFLQDYTFPRAVSTVQDNDPAIAVMPSYSTREIYTPGGQLGSLIQVDEFFAPTPFTIPQWQIPVPTRVSYDFNGFEGSFPECLHDDITIPSLRTGVKQVAVAPSGSSGESLGGTLDGQFFPATNFKTWAPYTTKDDQQYTDGGWYRVRIRVTPPPKPKIVKS